MFARLTALVGSGTALPFELGDPQPAAWGQWSHYKGTWKADGSTVSVFRISAMSKTDARLDAARNSAKRLRMLRHPNILSFKETVEVEERGETCIYLVTEYITPLSTILKSIDLTPTDREMYMAMGLHQVVAAVSFLNNDCKLIHGNICLASIGVTDSLDWKLHAFDLATEHHWQEAMTREMPLVYASFMVHPQYKPGEVAKSEWQVVRESPPYAVDSWGLGCLIHEVYSGTSLTRTEELREIDMIPQNVLPYYQKLLASQPSRRLDPAKLAESSVLKNKMSELVAFLENLALKEAIEKDNFFKRLPSLLPKVPTPVAQRKLLPMLASALEFGGAPPIALSTLLQIGSSLPEEEYEKQVVPILTKLFASTDRGIRRGLLENIQTFGPALPATLVEDQIFKHVETGFNDANPYLRELTLKSMVVLGPKLQQKTLNQSLLKHLAKLQVDEEPSIRANTTVLLGNLAPQMGEATCKKVLLNAFTRALKDPFPPARAAGLKAIIGSSQYHGAEAAATRVLPMIAPLCIDTVQEVRSSAMQCLTHFAAVLKENDKAMTEKERAAAAAAAPAGSSSSGATAASGGGGGGDLLTSFGWAVSSLVSRGHDQPTTGPTNTTSVNTGAGGMTGFGPSSSSTSSPLLPSRQPPPSTNTPHIPSTSANGTGTGTGTGGGTSIDEGNGWGDDDDDPLEDMMNAAEEEREARAKLSRLGLSTNGPTSTSGSRPGSGIGGNTMTSSSRTVASTGSGVRRGPVAAHASASRSSSTTTARPKSMKLGANKLGASALADDEDFNNW